MTAPDQLFAGINAEIPVCPTAAGAPLRAVLLYQRHLQPDEQVLQLLELQLVQNGYSVFVDREQTGSMDWAKEIERQLCSADAVAPLLSAESAQSELMCFEIEHAHEAAQMQHGRPRLLPVRINYTGPLPEPMATILNSIPYQLWEGPHDDPGLVTELLEALKRLPPPVVISKGARLLAKPAVQPPQVRPAAGLAAPATPMAFETVGGAVPLHSEFYIARPADGELRNAIIRRDSIILIKGARQMGKTSLLARGLQWAREQDAKVALTDFQKFNAPNLESPTNLYLTLAESLVDQLELPVLPADVWDERRGANVNFERFLRREVLAKFNAPLVWGLDEVDRLFLTTYGSEVFGLFRSWHNERALDPAGPWAGLTLVIAYATEAHLFITDMNQSPFNIGTRLTLEDFAPVQVAELNQRYHYPLKGQEELNRFIHLFGGHPYLVRRGLHELASKRMTLGLLETQASSNEGVFSDHLRRILVLLAKDPDLADVVRGVLNGNPCPTPESFYRLRSAGVMAGSSQSDVRPRCRLYADFLRRHLM
jgi:hypothetical protein